VVLRWRRLCCATAVAAAVLVAVGAPCEATDRRPALHVCPLELTQGGTFRVDVLAPRAAWARVAFAGRPVLLYRTAAGFRGLAGTRSLSTKGHCFGRDRGPQKSRQRFLGWSSPATPAGVVSVRADVRVGSRTWHLVQAVRVRAGRFPVRFLRVAPQLLDPRLAAYEHRRVLQATASPVPRPLWDGAFRPPVAGPVTSPYGVRSVYNGRLRGHHLGVDFRAPAGSAVRASQAGVVVLAEALPLGGNTVIVDHGAGVFSSYLHLSALAVRAGQRVRAGQVVGYVGSTGLSTAPHLHWALRVNGVPVDPLPWVRAGLATAQ